MSFKIVKTFTNTKAYSNMQSSLFFIVKTFLQKEQYQINTNELKLQILSHPSYPSLHAITGVLDHFGIENLALEVPKNKETLTLLPKHFIAHVKKDHTEELLVVTQKQNQISLNFEDKSTKTVSISNFLNLWDGIIVAIDKDNVSQNPQKVLSTIPLSRLIISLFGLTLLALVVAAQANFFQWTYFGLSLLGVVGSIFIIRHEWGLHSEIIQKFCTTSEKTSCDSVFKSDGAILFGNIHLSDLSIAYFSTLVFLSFLAISLHTVQLSTVAWSSGLALPLVFYTLFYQWRIVKKWCPLCLSIAAVVLLQSSSIFLLGGANFIVDVKTIWVGLFSFGMITLSWQWLKSVLQRHIHLNKLEIEHYKFKRNFTLFTAAHQLSPLLPTAIDTEKEIIFGKTNAAVEIILVTSPMCYYCKKTHELIENILKKHQDNIKITIRFNVNTKDEQSPAYKISSRLLELYDTQGKTKCQAALHDIYKEKADTAQWLEQWGACINPNHYRPILAAEKDWCTERDIHFTPALLVNGRLFPKMYDREDLIYFMEDLMEQK